MIETDLKSVHLDDKDVSLDVTNNGHTINDGTFAVIGVMFEEGETNSSRCSPYMRVLC